MRHPLLLAFNGRHLVFNDIHDNLKEISGVGGNLDSSQAAAESSAGAAVSATTGNLNASDNAMVLNSGNVTNIVNETDPGILDAFKTFANDNSYVSGMALEDAYASQAAAAGITAQALKQAGDLSAQETKTPIQQLTPLLIVGAVIIVGVAYALTHKG